MYRGRTQLGKEILLGTLCRDASLTPTAPAASPVMEIFAGATKVMTKAIPVMDKYGQTGLFGYRLFLDGRFSPGNYKVLYYYTVGSYAAVDQDSFDILAGGNPDGAVIQTYFFRKPHADFIVQQTDGGRLFAGRNPTA